MLFHNNLDDGKMSLAILTFNSKLVNLIKQMICFFLFMVCLYFECFIKSVKGKSCV